MQLNEPNLERFIYWCNERQRMFCARNSGAKAPWSDDPILNRHHFCNVHREDDRITRELSTMCVNLNMETVELPTYWTAARMFNHPPSVHIYFTDGLANLKYARTAGQKIFNTAYVVSTCGQAMDKIDYVHGVVNKVRGTPVNPLSCQAAFNSLRTVKGLGSFMSGQVVADLKYTPYLKDAPDFHTFAVMGPGSQKGLNLIFGAGTTEKNFMARLVELRHLVEEHIPPVHNQDLQNCLCEFSKYMRYWTGMPGRSRNYVQFKK